MMTLRRRMAINWTLLQAKAMLATKQGKMVPSVACVKMETKSRADMTLLVRWQLETTRRRELETSLPFSHLSRQ